MEAKIALLAKRPSGMSEDEWKERRRDAARDLGRLGDKRAVEPLIKIVETERFDAIAEIAIDALGRLGDKRAITPLREVARDGSRDRYVRDAATTALRRLGAAPATAEPKEVEPTPEEPASAGPGASADAGTADLGLGTRSGEEVPTGPLFPRDLLAASERWTFAVGALGLSYDTVGKRPQISGSASSRYRRGKEKPSFGYTFDAGLAVAGGAEDRSTETSATTSMALEIAAQGAAEARFYLSNPHGVFGHLDGALALGASATRVKSPMPGVADYKDFAPNVALLFGLGVGHGRVLDVGVTLRLRRIERLLRDARLLGRPINADVASRMFSAWWALRSELGSRRRLLATLAILREAGVLLSEADPGTVYAILRILEDGQLDERLSGAELRVGVGETFLGADAAPMADDVEWNRIETAFLSATLGRQLAGGMSEIVGLARADYKLAGDGPGFYTLGSDATWRRYFYGDAWDPRGAFEASLGAGLSDTEDDMADAATRLTARAGYLFVLSRASRISASARVLLEGDEVFVGLEIVGTYGLLDAAAAPW